MKNHTCSIVVDASIARAAGHTEYPTSKDCRAFLKAINSNKECRCVFSPDLNSEWKKHASHLSVTWKAQMVAKKRVLYLAETNNKPLREALGRCAQHLAGQQQGDLEHKIASALDKDAHLLEAASEIGKRVASLDETVRGYFRTCAFKNANIAEIAWVNPCFPDEGACDWVDSNAPLDKDRTLGYQP